MFSPLRHRARRELLAQPFPPAWLPILDGLPFYRSLDERGQQRIRDDLRVLIAEKEWEGCGGLVLTDEILVTIAAQASLLLLAIEHEYFADVRSILVYPSAYRTMPQQDAAGVVRPGQANLGEAWQRGPVILSWDAAKGGAVDPRDGHNLVLHEFAHKLDMLDGLADGTPPLQGREELREWVATMTAEFAALRAAAAGGHKVVLDHYGATNPAEFFAVATECFFEKSRQLRQRHPRLYAVLQDYYRQDPAERA
ncbi:MAG: zinc-dependent peptidase [Planctomycetes bacterium]|nr:zinc-dependent peptidase [Planctomycetota bacterium]MCB9885008.1 zinc-dependent peptidase [Planctomycetota bacterium]